MVWRLDRLDQSMTHLLSIAAGRGARGFDRLTESTDTTKPTGRLMVRISGPLGQFERDLIQELISTGLKAAAARGRKGGRLVAATLEKVARAVQSEVD